MNWLKRVYGGVLTAVVAVFAVIYGGSSHAQGSGFTIPTVGPAPTDVATAYGTLATTLITAVFGLIVGIMLVVMLMKWLRRAK